MRQMRSADLIGVPPVATLMTGLGSGVSHVGATLAGISAHRADMLAVGVDPTPVGAARQIDRVKQARGQKL